MKNKKLLAQILKFGLVGGTSFLVDFILYAILTNLLSVHYLVAAGISFAISLVVNYLLSMRFVFVRREDISKKREFFTFIILSIIGGVLNEFLLFICLDLIYPNSLYLTTAVAPETATLVAKVFAAGVVMVYNFISKKIFLEKRPEP